jgi:hypothetical protein
MPNQTLHLTAAALQLIGLNVSPPPRQVSLVVTPIIKQMLSEEDILLELKYTRRWQEAYLSGERGHKLPKVPKNRDAQDSKVRLLVGLSLHPFLAILMETAQLLRFATLQAALARIRIATDTFSFEPKSCGLNNAFTHLGLALLAKKNIAGARKCLEASWRVHPCPHNSSYGLSKGLVSKLRDYPEAESEIAEYLRIGKKFVSWSDQWAEGIVK